MTKSEVEAMLARAESCADCMDGVLLRDSLYFDLDREDEDQKCPAQIHQDIPALARAHQEAMEALQGLRDTATLLGLAKHPVDDFLAAYRAPASTQPAGGSES